MSITFDDSLFACRDIYKVKSYYIKAKYTREKLFTT